MHNKSLLVVLFSTMVFAVGCGGAVTGQTTTVPLVDAEPIPDDELAASLRELRRHPAGSRDRGRLRDGILANYAEHTPGLIESADYDAVVAHLGLMTALLTPEDLGEGRVPAELEPLANFVLAEGSRRGDEGRVLASLLLLGALVPDDESIPEDYLELVRWGRDARAGDPDLLRRYRGLIEVWDGHAVLTPAPEVLQMLASLHVERRDSVVAAVNEGRAPFVRGMGALPEQLRRIAPLDVAAVYLRHGDLNSAINHVQRMGAGSDTALQLLSFLDEARREGEEGAFAMHELAEAYRGARSEVSLGICREGLVRYPDDSRFPVCLARVAAEQGRPADATGWYALAIEVSPDEQALYDEALAQLNELIESGMFSDDPGEARSIAAHASSILAERTRRWPGRPSPLEPEQLEFLMGMLEMNAGDAAEARRHLEESLEIRENAPALMQLGLLLERTGDGAGAAERYRRALDIIPQLDRSDDLARAELLEHLGDAFAMTAQPDQAERMYRQALALWTEAAPSLEGPPLALLQVRRGVLLDRVGRRPEARTAFEIAIASAPRWKETYATILSHLVSAAPDPELAADIFARALRQVTLDPEWRVYFALWVKSIHARAGVPAEPSIDALLTQLGASTSWSGRLARFGAGEITYDELLHAADGVGQRAEAHFYEGARLLGAGDSSAARRQFEEVLRTEMVSFYEFAMAQSLLRELGVDVDVDADMDADDAAPAAQPEDAP